MWTHTICILSVMAFPALILQGGATVAQGLAQDLSRLPASKKMVNPAQALSSPEDLSRKLASLDYAGDYSPSSNVDSSSLSPPPLRRRLLQDYSPMANQRNPSTNRRLLQDYSPAANERAPSPPQSRKLLQDYSPMANQRSPSSNNRKLLQDYSPMVNQRVQKGPTSPSHSRRLLQDYSPMANDRSQPSPP